jgi:hypothetical protein
MGDLRRILGRIFGPKRVGVMGRKKKEDVMSGAYSTHGRDEKCTHNFSPKT